MTRTAQQKPKEFHVRFDDGRTVGPIDAQSLKSLAVSGDISPESPLKVGAGEWTTAGKVRGLFDSQEPTGRIARTRRWIAADPRFAILAALLAVIASVHVIGLGIVLWEVRAHAKWPEYVRSETSRRYGQLLDLHMQQIKGGNPSAFSPLLDWYDPTTMNFNIDSDDAKKAARESVIRDGNPYSLFR
jgi:hypothetical protein